MTLFSAELLWCLVFVQKINYQEKSRKICQKSYLPEDLQSQSTRQRRVLGGPHPLAAPGGGVAAPGTPSTSLFAYNMPPDLKTDGGSTFFQKEFRSAATIRFHDSEPKTPFWHPAETGNLERIIAIVITNASPSTTDVSLIHE